MPAGLGSKYQGGGRGEKVVIMQKTEITCSALYRSGLVQIISSLLPVFQEQFLFLFLIGVGPKWREGK